MLLWRPVTALNVIHKMLCQNLLKITVIKYMIAVTWDDVKMSDEIPIIDKSFNESELNIA